MKRFVLAAVAVASVASVALPASAQSWMSINQRQRAMDHRIDQGVRSGALTRNEAFRLRAEFRRIAQLEGYYRRTQGRLVQWERNDLDRRMDALQRRIRFEKHDRQDRRRY